MSLVSSENSHLEVLGGDTYPTHLPLHAGHSERLYYNSTSLKCCLDHTRITTSDKWFVFTFKGFRCEYQRGRENTEGTT